eukprot:366313-Chlamydomonas_euryale.AAC.3
MIADRLRHHGSQPPFPRDSHRPSPPPALQPSMHQVTTPAATSERSQHTVTATLAVGDATTWPRRSLVMQQLFSTHSTQHMHHNTLNTLTNPVNPKP